MTVQNAMFPELLKHISGSDTAIIVLHEIYGINQHITEVCQKLAAAGYDIYCPHFLGLDRPFDYSQQAEAYAYFANSVGFQVANRVVQLVDEVRPSYNKVLLVGYSIGATIAWLTAARAHCDGLIGYYGSRIRDFMTIVPTCPALLLFASQEKSFDAAVLVSAFEQSDTITAHLLRGSHGFCDPYGESFHSVSADEAEEYVQQFLKRL